MREGFDREMDSLLRRHARGTAESRLWGDGAAASSQGTHLDADELNAFAEGALPTAARVAAASHLADCASCRGVAVGLARVAEAEVKNQEVKPLAVAAAARAEPSRTSSLSAFFTSIFSPRVMRFAVPVLALSLVGVVSYVALRSNKGSLEAAREGRHQNVSTQSAPSAVAGSDASAENANASGLMNQNANVTLKDSAAAGVPPGAPKGHGSADAPQPAEVEAPAVRDAQPSDAAASAAPPPPPPATSTEAAPAMSKAGPPKPSKTEGDEDARADRREESQNKAARGAEPTDDLSVNDSSRQRNVAQRSMNQVQMPDGGARNATKRGEDSNSSLGYGVVGGGASKEKDKDSERGATRSETAGRSRPARDAEKKADEDEVIRVGETRSAAGHRFRREGSAWVDVNYKSNMPSTGVRRGTESFRALVADVPEVGRVAEAIGGEVIVVVGGRAYRIH